VHAADPYLEGKQRQFDQIDAELVAVRKLLPMRVDELTQLVGVSRNGPKVTYEFSAKMGALKCDDFCRRKYSEQAVANVCGDADLRAVLTLGFAMVYNVSDEKGLPLSSTYIDKSSCK
jgi:hypothetical protein